MPWILTALVAAVLLIVGGVIWVILNQLSPRATIPSSSDNDTKILSVATSTSVKSAETNAAPAPASAASAQASAPSSGSPTRVDSAAGDVAAPATGQSPARAVADVKVTAARVVEERIFLAGSSGQTAFHAAHALSDGSILIGGGSDDLAWTGNARRIELPADGLPRPGGQRYAFILHLEPDLAAIRAVWYFPKGASGDIRRIRSTEVPGQPTGDLYISGEQATFGPQFDDDGYWIARLDANGVGRAPSRALWVHAVRAGGRKAGSYAAYKGDGVYKIMQPWDVGGDGRVAYAMGAPHDNAWAALHFIDANGKPLPLPGLPYRNPDAYGWALKAGNNGSLRSTTQADFDLRQEDENGNPGRKGRYPDDYYFQKPAPDRDGPGYTGYRVGGNPTQRICPPVFDRRNNHLYFGTSPQTRLPGGNPDFEPAIVALDETGALKWWARGYREIERVGENANKPVDAINSPPDQYIDGVALDYANDRLVVIGRCHGNGVINFWRGHEVRVRDGREGFQKQYTGTHGNAHYSWMGRYTLDGKIRAATYVADLGDNLKPNKRFPQGHPLAGWPMPNDGWHNLQTTRIHGVTVDAAGRPYLIGLGKRSWTTVDAKIPNLIPTGGSEPLAAWCPFVRVYDADLGDIAYGSLVRGPWPNGQDPGHEIALESVVALADGILAVGKHTSKGSGSNLPCSGVPAWGAGSAPGSVSGVVAILRVKAP